jgi:hypothetical protein
MGFKKGLKGRVVEYGDDSARGTSNYLKIGTVVDRVNEWYLIADNDCQIRHVRFKHIRRVILISKFEKVSNE